MAKDVVITEHKQILEADVTGATCHNVGRRQTATGAAGGQQRRTGDTQMDADCTVTISY